MLTVFNERDVQLVYAVAAALQFQLEWSHPSGPVVQAVSAHDSYQQYGSISAEVEWTPELEVAWAKWETKWENDRLAELARVAAIPVCNHYTPNWARIEYEDRSPDMLDTLECRTCRHTREEHVRKARERREWQEWLHPTEAQQ